MRQWLENIEAEWPAFKYLGFGCYYAWIFLCYSSDVLFSYPAGINGMSSQTVMYLLSTTALALTLLAAALLHKRAAKLVASVKFVAIAALIASLATGMVGLTDQDAGNPLFWTGCVLSGVGTAFVSLRFGMMYSVMAARKAMTNAAAAFVVAGGLYFVVIGLPHELRLVLCVGLPLMAALCTVTFDPSRKGRPGREVIPTESLPARFFMKLVIAIATFSAIAGFYNGMGANIDLAGAVSSSHGHALMVFAVSVVALLLLVVGGAIDRGFDLSKLYYPIIVLGCFGIIVVPLVGGYDPVQRMIIGAAYNLFILFVWCLLAHVANRTDLAPVMVFGFGRGASAVGTTVGWLGCTLAAPSMAENADSLMAFAVVMVFVLVVVSMVVLKEGTIDQMLAQTDVGPLRVGDVPGSRQPRVRCAEEPVVPASCAASGCGVAGSQGCPLGASGDVAASQALADADVRVAAEAGASGGADAAQVAAAAEGCGTASQSCSEEQLACAASSSSVGVAAASLAAFDALRESCGAVSERFGLSDREAEVLVLLTRGRTIDQISQELCVSFNTAKSHVRHVYTKTGVHTRKELFSLVREARNS